MRLAVSRSEPSFSDLLNHCFRLIFGEICNSEPVVVQTYVRNPLLIDCLKFDFRIYILVSTTKQPEPELDFTGMLNLNARLLAIPGHLLRAAAGLHL